jgi:hypothetical protein
LKLWLPVSSSITTDDATLSRLITATSQDFMRATLRPDLLQTTYTEVHKGDGGSRMIAFHWPIVAITSLTVDGASIAASGDKIAAGYYIDSDIDPERRILVYLNGFCFTDGAAVALGYKAGYVQPGASPATGEIALPGDIEQAVIDWCGYRYKNRPNVATTQRRSTEGESVGVEVVDAPPNVLQVIERYKRCFPSLDRREEERNERMTRGAAKSKGMRY